jgi:acyl carrier protein
MADTITEHVRRVVSDVLGVPSAQLTETSSPETIESWDSVQHLSIVLSIEQEFGIQLDPEDIEKARSVGALERLVRSKRG